MHQQQLPGRCRHRLARRATRRCCDSLPPRRSTIQLTDAVDIC
jgi:hypothetical protein